MTFGFEAATAMAPIVCAVPGILPSLMLTH
jgi:hypothetical protein